jgi:hypothetical protein
MEPLRHRVTKRAGSRQKGLLMAFKLLRMAQGRWRRIKGAHRIPLVRVGVGFTDGMQAERRNAACSGDGSNSVGLADPELPSESH